jgi:hypothetical protein
MIPEAATWSEPRKAVVAEPPPMGIADRHRPSIHLPKKTLWCRFNVRSDLRSGLSDAAFRLWVILKIHDLPDTRRYPLTSDKKGYVFPSRTELIRLTGWGHTKIWRAMTELERVGLIRSEPDRKGHRVFRYLTDEGTHWVGRMEAAGMSARADAQRGGHVRKRGQGMSATTDQACPFCGRVRGG